MQTRIFFRRTFDPEKSLAFIEFRTFVRVCLFLSFYKYPYFRFYMRYGSKNTAARCRIYRYIRLKFLFRVEKSRFVTLNLDERN